MKMQLAREAVPILRNDSPDGVYVLESIEYVRSSELPDNELFGDRSEVKSLLDITRKSLKNRTKEKISKAIALAVAEVEKAQLADEPGASKGHRRSA
ncbi:hypothetical protein SAMN05216276_108629 [Streptosporangium subroseum]|uniref:Uncharacterized protein n=1 Tax=Streptosporangium subroseum TaxID=106412 RepID=A0A239P5S5_9ACTN|nr:hypothetical protein [Streptosporangium subroseum]SNT61958.1 hypothetical protein SAMN05216276_108629 [Streptosporangium subroseum]